MDISGVGEEPVISSHLTIKANNRGTLFYEPADYHEFLIVVKTLFSRYGIQLHTFSLLPDHVHLLLSADRYLNTAAVLILLYQEYAEYFNLTHRRRENKLELYHSMIDLAPEDSALVYYRYIELTPVHAGLVDYPAEYPWSGFGRNAMGEDCGLLIAHPAYEALGPTEQARRECYRRNFEQQYGIWSVLAAG